MLTEIHRPNDRHRIRQQMAPRDLIETAEMRKPRRPDLAPVRPLTAVANHIHAHLPLGRLDGRIRLPGRDGVALCEQQKMVDQRLHILLHRRAGRGRDLIVLDAHRAWRHLIQALMDDAQALAELLHPAQVAIIAVAVDADGDIELHLAVGVVRGALAYVPGHAGAAQHDAREAVVERVGGGDDADALGAPDPDPVVGEELLGLVDAVAELGGPLVDVVEEAEGDVGVHAAGADVGGVEAGAGDALVEFLGRC